MKIQLLILVFMLIVGCSDTSNETRIFAEQEAALNNAKEVEDQILKAAEAQRQTINENTDE